MLVLEADLMFPLLLVFANHIFTTKNVETLLLVFANHIFTTKNVEMLLLVFANYIFITKNVERNQHIVLVKSTKAFLQNR